jgi:hypothetical protein
MTGELLERILREPFRYVAPDGGQVECGWEITADGRLVKYWRRVPKKEETLSNGNT